MCGIIGVVGNNLNKDKLIGAVDLLSHRGPDDKGYLSDNNLVFFGHTRLSVIDLSINGKQPMKSEDGNLWITYNGEIYNFKKLRAELENRGYGFKSQTDTEVILNLYKEKGRECVRDLNGMFAFAIYDKKKQELFIARDRLGIKPFYYALYNNNFVFASEIKAILACGMIPKEVNWQAIYDYFSFLFVPCPATAFEHIKQLPPAHCAVLDLSQMKFNLSSYWTPYEVNNGSKESLIDYEDLKFSLGTLLNDSVASQLVSDVPLGLFLSGGIDSSILALLAAKNSTSRLKTFTVIFEDKDLELYDESIYAKKVSDVVNSEHIEIALGIQKPDSILELIDCFDQPFANPTFYLSYLISKATKKHVTVALSGAGGDELFGGYPRYKALPYAKALSSVPKLLSRCVREFASLIPENNFSHLPRRIKLFVRGMGESLSEQYLQWTYYLSDDEKALLLKPMLAKKALLTKSTNIITSYLSEISSKDLLNRIQYVDLKTFLLDNVLEYTDKTSMAVGLETRVPYLDHRIVELSFKIPQKYKIYKGNLKYILKETFKDLLPREIINAPKKGFCAPVSLWIDKHFNYYFDNLLTCDYVGKQGIMDWDVIQLLRNQHKLKKRDNSMQLFGVIMFDMWYRKYFS